MERIIFALYIAFELVTWQFATKFAMVPRGKSYIIYQIQVTERGKSDLN